MKLITAIIQEDKLDSVREALVSAEIGRITVTESMVMAGKRRLKSIEVKL